MATTASYIPGVSLADKLRLAASKGQLDKCKELVANGASFEPDREGRTALHYASLNGYAEVAQLLAVEGCDIDAQDNLGYTALHRAAAQGHLDVIKVLMSEGCLVDRQDEVHGNTAVHEASWNGYSKTLELLVKNRASCNLINKAGFSPLHLAAQNGHNQSARVLLYAGINTEHKNNYGDTALHTAARYGHAGVTRILNSARCNINSQNKNGDTALHIASALKRRKITKLLVDAHCDITIKNKQNETAVDVARRKDHPEVVLIITSQAKAKKDKKKGEKKGEKKEKRGFFFRRKKAKETGPSVAPSMQSIPPSIAAPSEISSARCNPPYNDHMPPEHLLQGFHRHQVQVHHGNPQPPHPHQSYPHAVHPVQAVGTRTSRGANTAGSIASSRATNITKQGLVAQYASKEGVAYYKDLAGNIKQGPIGFAPVCNCGPQFKKLEQRVDADKANLYDHIDASHRMLNDRLDTLDRRTAQQVYSIDKLTKERLEAGRQERDEFINMRLLQERLETERQLEVQQDCIRTELKAWVDSRICDLEGRVASHEDCCDTGHTRCHHRKLHDGCYEPSGRLYRSKSDETLSMSSSHPGRKGARAKSKKSHEPKKGFIERSHKDEKRRSMKIKSDRSKPTGQPNGVPLPSGRTPDGQSFTDYTGHKMPVNNNWTPPNQMGPRQSTTSYIYTVKEEEANALNLSDSCIMVNNIELSPVSNDNGISPHPIYPSPEYEHEYHQVEIHHSKTDSGSNPDSGYGSKIYNARPSSAKSESTDQHNMSTTTDGSGSGSSPTTFTSGTSESGDPLHVTRHFFDTVSNQMEKWYERRLMEVEKKTENRVKQESAAMQTRIQKLEDKVTQEKLHMSPQIETCEGTQV